MKKDLTSRQLEVLLAYSERDGRDKAFTEMAELFEVSKPTIFAITDTLLLCGYCVKNEGGEVRITPLGWEFLGEKPRQVKALAAWLMSDFALIPLNAEREARRMVAALDPETIKVIAQVGVERMNVDPETTSEELRALKPGVYEVPFSVMKRDSNELSMGDRGFEKPAILRVNGMNCALYLFSQTIEYKPLGHKVLKGSLDQLWYKHNGRWHECRSRADGGYRVPGGALKTKNGSATVRIRARASVGVLKMPESEADLAVYLDKMKEIRDAE